MRVTSYRRGSCDVSGARLSVCQLCAVVCWRDFAVVLCSNLIGSFMSPALLCINSSLGLLLCFGEHTDWFGG